MCNFTNHILVEFEAVAVDSRILLQVCTCTPGHRQMPTMLLSACWMTAFCDESLSAFDFRLSILFKFDSIFLLSCQRKRHNTETDCQLLAKYLSAVLPPQTEMYYPLPDLQMRGLCSIQNWQLAYSLSSSLSAV